MYGRAVEKNISLCQKHKILKYDIFEVLIKFVFLNLEFSSKI